MTFKELSKKQKQIFRWCYKNKYKAIICDGAVRSGKTICMITSFILWAMKCFNGANFSICGKSVGSAERNIIMPLQAVSDITHYFKVSYARSLHLLTVEGMGKKNYFYVFGGKDESSYTLIQGITLSGIFLDEVALMPQSFVNQAITRTLSVENALYWFNCNPESPAHWFYTEWICNAEKKNALHLHFLMSDNPTLSQKQLEEAEKMFAGVFYQRYILGLWVAAEGLIYPEQAQGIGIVPTEERKYFLYYVSIDYGTLNPFSAGLWGKSDGVWYRIKEYYYSGREKGKPLTDEEYYTELKKLIGNIRIEQIIIDPSAASFIACIRRHGEFSVRQAKNEVVEGIRKTSDAFKREIIKINDCCKAAIKEFSIYRWDDKSEIDRPIKESDHAMDDIRYFVNTIVARDIAWKRGD